MQVLLMLTTLISFYQVRWENDYFDINLNDSYQQYFDMPSAKLYNTNNNKELPSELRYLKGVNRTSLSVVNSSNVKTFKVDYRVYFIDYDLSYDHTIVFNIVDTISPEFINLRDITMPIGNKLLTSKEILSNIDYKDNYNIKEDIIINIYKLHLVNTLVVGSYELDIELIDSSGNKNLKTIYYSIVNDNYPTIKYSDPLILEYGKEFVYYDYFKISDPYDTNLIIDLDISKINFNKLGNYPISVRVRNNGNNQVIVNTQLIIKDTKAPALVLKEKQVINVNSSNINLYDYILIANDNYDVLSIKDVNITSNIDYSLLGTYDIHYELRDTSNNITTKNLVLEIKDLEKPKVENIKLLDIELNDNLVNYYNYFNIYDNYSTNESLIIKFNDNKVNYKKLGTYLLEVIVTDEYKNTSYNNFEVTITDKYPPNIELVNDIIINDYTYKSSSYFKKYFIISDNYDSYEDISLYIEGDIDYTRVGIYDVNLIFSDTSSNTCKLLISIYIIDDSKPTLLLESNLITIDTTISELDYKDLIEGYYDNYNSNKDLILKIEDNIIFGKTGYYNIVYTLIDESLNTTIKQVNIRIDKKYERLINGSSITINQDDKFIIGSNIEYSEDIVELITIPSYINTTTTGLKQIKYIAYDSRGNYDIYIQDVVVVSKKKFDIKKYIPIILFNLLIVGYSSYYIYKYQRQEGFKN